MQSKVKYELKERSENLSKVSEQEIKKLEEEIKYINKEINEQIDSDSEDQYEAEQKSEEIKNEF